MKHALISTVIMLASGFVCISASANTLTFTLNNQVQSGGYGDTLIYSATVSAPVANTGAEYLNGDSFNLGSPLGLDDTDFFANFPLFLNPGDSFTGSLFTVTLPSSGSTGTHAGTFSLLGGTDAAAFDVIGTASFTTNLTPEPSSLFLLGTGLIAGISALKQKLRHRL